MVFDGHGCAISLAATSMVAEHLEGKTFSDVYEFQNDDVFRMLGIDLSPMRMKCALLGIKALQKSIILHRGKNE